MTIVSRKHKFVFLKSHKTASSSIENFLISKTELGDDIYFTSIEIQALGIPRARQNFTVCPGQSRLWGSLPRIVKALRKRIPGGHRLLPSIAQHDSAERVRFLVGRKFFEDALKAVPVRNPWDALVSNYEWLRSGRQGRSAAITENWNEWLNKALSKNEVNSGVRDYLLYSYVFLSDRWIANHVIPFECIDDSLSDLGKKLSLPIPSFLKEGLHHKKSRTKLDYRTYYTDVQAERVAEHFKLYLDVVQYEFEGLSRPPSLGI